MKSTEKLQQAGGFLWRHRTKITLGIAIILAILYLKQCGTIKYERKKNKQNTEALTKDVETYKLKNGEFITQKATLLASKKELEELNSSLKAEYDILKKEKSKPKLIIETKIVYRDTGSVNNTMAQLDSNKYSLKFAYSDSDGILNIHGRSEFFAQPKFLDGSKTRLGLNISPGKTFFDSTEIKVGIVLGVKEDNDGIDRIFAKPKPFTDKITFEDLDAVQLEEYYKSKYNNHKDKKKGRVAVGIYGGFGFSTDGNGVVRMGPQLGIGLNYQLFRIPFL